MKHYEFTYLTKADMPEDEAKSLQDKLTASVAAKKGVVTDQPKAYKKRLAYRIRKQDSAYVNTILFQMEPADLEVFKKEAGEDAQILRGLVVTYKPQPVRREPEVVEQKETAETIVAKPVSVEAEPVAEVKKEISAAVKSFTETKPAAKVEEPTKEEAKTEVEKEESKEVKTVKPKRKARPKAELEDIEEKLEEILK